MTHNYVLDDVYFGYRISQFGKPTCWKGTIPFPSMHSADDRYYPFTQWRKLTEEEINMSLDELSARYPYVRGR